MTSLSDHTEETLGARLRAAGASPMHARELLRRAWYDGAADPFDATPLGARARARLRAELPVCAGRVAARERSADGTVKLLVAYADGARVETVLMDHGAKAAACLSTQVGCAAGCVFCASGAAGLDRQLSAGEIIAQYQLAQRQARAGGRRLHTVVLMGIGEPLHNYDAVVTAVRRITDPPTGGFGRDHVTLSTVGVAAKMRRLAGEGLGIHLALSLHAPDEALRVRLVPRAQGTIAELLDAATEFRARTGKFVTLAYTLIAGVNDRPEQAARLADLLDGRRFHVNLIPVNPVNPVAGGGFRPPGPAALRAFFGVLRDRRVVVHVRRPQGDEVAAACGQLRRAWA